MPALRVRADSPTFGKVALFFFQKSTTRSYYLIDFSRPSLHGAEIWHTCLRATHRQVWKPHQAIEQFWKILKALLHIKEMQLPGNGLYTALLIKVIACLCVNARRQAYLLALRWKAHKAFSKLTLTQLMRKISREEDLKALLSEHFHGHLLLT